MGSSIHVKAKVFVAPLLSLAIALGVSAPAQEATIARLTHEDNSGLPHASIGSTWSPSHKSRPGQTAALPETLISRSAANALFVRSDLERARVLATEVLRRNPRDVEALFVRMEVAAMQADGATVLDAAVRLCEAAEAQPGDPRAQLASARIREAAGNTPQFRAAVPQIKGLLANSNQPWIELRVALLQAAMDGTPGLDPYALSRAAGILTDWRVVGPLDRRSLELDDSIASVDDLTHAFYQNRAVENFQFPDGRITLPDYLSHHGMYYGVTQFGSLNAARWRVEVEGAGRVTVYVDGRRVLKSADGRAMRSNSFEAPSGPHRVLLKFTSAGLPLRVAIAPDGDNARPPLPSKASAQELAYLLAASHYASGDFEDAVTQINAVASATNSAALQFLLAQSLKPGTPQSLTAWDKVHTLAPVAFSANVAIAQNALKTSDRERALRLVSQVLTVEPTNEQALEVATNAGPFTAMSEAKLESLWARRAAAHPSCANLQSFITFYRAHQQPANAGTIQQKLEGCAPDSLDYAKALSQQGSHVAAANAVRQLLAAAPLNRPARLMLVRELQLAGDDRAAQQAAAEWLHVAPGAERYHRLAASAPEAGKTVEDTAEFYEPYRRDVAVIEHEIRREGAAATAVDLLNDHVAVSRSDGSVSLYIHTARRLAADEAAQPAAYLNPPRGAEVLVLRVLHSDGSSSDLSSSAEIALSPSSLAAGDIVDEEYVVHYVGDGGIPEHPEAFQFVFGSFNQRVLTSRFVVLTPAEQADRGVVLETGGTPTMSETVAGGMLQRIWSTDGSPATPETTVQDSGLPIVRVVEQENGWAVPSNAEHQRRIETIHPGPRPQDS